MDYIKGEGPDSYRRKRFTDEVVFAAVVEVEAAQAFLRAYWDIGTIPEELDPRMKITEKTAEEWQEWLDADGQTKAHLEKGNRDIRRLKALQDRERLRARVDPRSPFYNARFDVELLRWGYVTSARTPAGEAFINQRFSGDATVTPVAPQVTPTPTGVSSEFNWEPEGVGTFDASEFNWEPE
jgi:hypothetical protein